VRRLLFGLFRTTIDLADVRPLESEPSHASELAALLRTYISGEELADSAASLKSLVAAAVGRFGYTA
jgi:hypothetical protein